MRASLSSFLIGRNSDEIARDHPQFKQVVRLPWHAKWVGTLTPMFQEYEVSISFSPGTTDEQFDYPGPKVEVEVLNPELHARREPPAPIPHVYRHPSLTETPLLCLFWPADRDWDQFKSIADFIIPWTAEWLANYELWRVTGTWASPEAPHDVQDEPEKASSPMSSISAPSEIENTRFGAALHKAELLSGTALEGFPYFMCSRGI